MGKAIAITSFTALLGTFLWLAGWSIAHREHLHLVGLLEIALYAAVTGGVIVAAWSWVLRRRLSGALGASVIRGIVCAVILIIAFELSAPVRSVIAEAWFPYATQLRFGLPGAVLTWSVLDALAIGAVIYAMAKRNLTTRWSGP